MARKTLKDFFYPKNPSKYCGGKLPCVYRSSWELCFMRLLDEHPHVISWASEALSIPYKNPLRGQWSMYVPDFFVCYMKNNKQYMEVIEVKPLKEVPGYVPKTKKGTIRALTEREKMVQVINAAKWQAGMAFCAKRGWMFRIATEDQIFSGLKP